MKERPIFRGGGAFERCPWDAWRPPRKQEVWFRQQRWGARNGVVGSGTEAVRSKAGRILWGQMEESCCQSPWWLIWLKILSSFFLLCEVLPSLESLCGGCWWNVSKGGPAVPPVVPCLRGQCFSITYWNKEIWWLSQSSREEVLFGSADTGVGTVRAWWCLSANRAVRSAAAWLRSRVHTESCCRGLWQAPGLRRGGEWGLVPQVSSVKMVSVQ